jgi:hypothetical protein
MMTEERTNPDDVEIDPSFELRFCEPEELTFHELPSGRRAVTIRDERTCFDFRVRRCFPLSLPQAYISIVDGAGAEVAILRDMSGLDERGRCILEQELERGYFVPRILKILSLRDEFGMQVWNVVTDRGDVEFVVREPRDKVKFVGAARVLITDVDDNRYEIRDMHALDRASRGLVAHIG